MNRVVYKYEITDWHGTENPRRDWGKSGNCFVWIESILGLVWHCYRK